MSGGTATIIGATGLVGSYLLKLMLADDYYVNIRLIGRRAVVNQDPRVEWKVIDFDNEEMFRSAITGSTAVFCAVGTTQKKVKGDRQAYRKVDFNIPVTAARSCKVTGCEVLVLVSSIGADSSSRNFYLQLKGEVEDEVKKLSIKSLHIFRPSLLLGPRNESRFGERIGKVIMQAFSIFLAGKLKKYKPIHARKVATAMLQAAKLRKDGVFVYEYGEMVNSE